MKVCLYQVGRNLNRVYRTCEAFGVSDLLLLDCKDSYLKGNLFKATNRLNVLTIGSLVGMVNTLGVETFYTGILSNTNWGRVDTIVIGGETQGLPHSFVFNQYATIPMFGKVSGLTVEASLAIVLYEWRRHESVRKTVKRG